MKKLNHQQNLENSDNLKLALLLKKVETATYVQKNKSLHDFRFPKTGDGMSKWIPLEN
jgi:hypothetical protein